MVLLVRPLVGPEDHQDGHHADRGHTEQPAVILAGRGISRWRAPVTRRRAGLIRGPIWALWTHQAMLCVHFTEVVTARRGRPLAPGRASIVGPVSEIDPKAVFPGGRNPPPLAPGTVPRGTCRWTWSTPPGTAVPVAAAPELMPGDGPFLDRPGVPPTTKHHAWAWLIYAVAGFVVGQLLAGVFGMIAGVIAGKTSGQITSIASAPVPPEWYVVSTLLGLWIGFFGAPWLASRRHGTRHFLADLGVRFRLIDLVGIAVGIGGQIVIVILYLPFQHDIHNFNAPSQKLTGGSHGGGFLIVALATVIVAPFMEELLFRGLLLKALVRLFTPGRRHALTGPGGRRRPGRHRRRDPLRPGPRRIRRNWPGWPCSGSPWPPSPIAPGDWA